MSTHYPFCSSMWIEARQGDPLSPYLFLFCMDILSRLPSLAVDIQQFKGIHTRSQALIISHLLFADDSLLFFRASQEVCTNINLMIERFCTISNQMLNLQKSFFSNLALIFHNTNSKNIRLFSGWNPTPL